ncbi:MAG: 2,3-bisphosphoglycerate-independent phosphoglycerate mutase [Cardiobacteriaceae bacterium]|nr:2,3-bisphosphoglycerate-independent phosphoglycerate mutase [Cardiobacteriaceae bacterium]
MASTVLLILDGWGQRDAAPDNAITLANTPNWDRLVATHPRMFIRTDGEAVGLPRGQMGNSEVGHMNIGAGRVIYQDFTRISLASERDFADNDVLIHAVRDTPTKTIHVFGLLSAGGVHSHEEHLFAFLRLAVREGAQKVVVHAFLDGRDTAPQCAAESLKKLAALAALFPQIVLADISGRYYAMDRDKRWERTGAVYDLVRSGKAEFAADSGLAALEAAYARGEMDEFVKPTVIAPHPIADGDSVVFINFRSDRARQLTQLFVEEGFDGYDVSNRPKLAHYVTMTSYRDDFKVDVAFPAQDISETLGEVVARAGLKQLRTAETEKYPHVTYFFNGGNETPNEGEVRQVVPSPKVATYDLQPEMSIAGVTQVLVDGIESGEYGLLVCNFANPDMVGHTGVIPAVVKAVEAVDDALGKVMAAVEKTGASILVTADHGNCEQLIDETTGQPHTSHTTNVVPLIYHGARPAHFVESGALCDLAPTLLAIMGIAQPKAMSGKSLLVFED